MTAVQVGSHQESTRHRTRVMILSGSRLIARYNIRSWDMHGEGVFVRGSSDIQQQRVLSLYSVCAFLRRAILNVFVLDLA